MRRAGHVWRSILLAGLMVLVAAFPGRGAPEPVAGTFTLYTSESEDDVNAITQDFMRRYPGVRVNIFRAGSGPVVAKLQAEMQAGKIQADVIWFADIDFFRVLAGRDLLQPYAPPAGRRAPAQYHYSGDRMHEVRLIFNVIAYNTRIVRFKPSSWWDLTLPRYRGRAGMPSPFVSGAAFNHVGTFAAMREFGWGYYEKLKANNAVVLRSNGDVARALASGEVVIAQIVDFFVRRLKAEGSPVDHVWPQEGALLVPTPIGIIKGTANLPAAQAFVNYLYTPEAQQIFVRLAYIPVIPGIPYPANTPDLADFKPLQPNLAYIERNREEIRRRFAELFGGAQ